MMPLCRLLPIATALLVSGHVAAQQAPLGRLFFTPEQRAALDAQRQQGDSRRGAAAQGTSLILQGLVQRSDGRGTAWVNGQSVHNPTQGTTGTTPAITIGTRDIRVGERLNQTTGEHQDLLQGGEIKVTPAGRR